MPRIAPSHHSADDLEGSLGFETLIAELSTRFINLPPSKVDHEIEDALRRVCELLGLDYAVLWQWSGDAPEVIAPTHAYPALDVAEPAEPMNQEQFPWVVEQMLAGRRVVAPSLDALPAEAAVDRESARLGGIQSNLTLPLAVGGEPPVGALAFNTLTAQRDWPDALVNRLQLATQVFTNALARRRQELRLQRARSA